MYNNVPAIIFGDHTRIIKYIDIPCFIGADGVKLLNLTDNYKLKYDYKFLYYYLSSQHIPDTGYNRHFEWLKEVSIQYASLPRQQEIAQILDKANALIERRREQLRELDSLAESLFYTMFGDPVTNPMGWEKKKLGELYDIGSSKRIFANENTEEGIPFYRRKEIAELGDGKEISLELFISKEKYENLKLSNKMPTKGDNLIAAIGATIGKMWIVDTRDNFYFKDGNILWVKNNGFISLFIYNVLFRLIADLKAKIVNGGAYPALTSITMNDLEIILPPLSLQTQFAERIEKIEAQKAKVKQALCESEDLFQRLMQDLFRV